MNILDTRPDVTIEICKLQHGLNWNSLNDTMDGYFVMARRDNLPRISGPFVFSLGRWIFRLRGKLLLPTVLKIN